MFIEAWRQFNEVLIGKRRSPDDSLENKVKLARERFKRRAQKQEGIPVTPKELGWEG